MIKKNKKTVIPSGVGSFVWEVVKIFTFAAIIIIPIRMFLFQPFLVQGQSMEPNFSGGEYLIVNEIGYKKVQIGTNGSGITVLQPQKVLQRGDSIVFRFPKNKRQFFIKRVIALPGERITVQNGDVHIFNDVYPDGRVLDEEYLPESYPRRKYEWMPSEQEENIDVIVAEDEYFVMGDNRGESFDSRVWGPLQQGFVMGKVAVRVWPIDKFTLFN